MKLFLFTSLVKRSVPVIRTNKHVYGERAFWVKGEEAKMVRERTLTVVIREMDRSDPAKTPLQWLPLFERIPVYTIRTPGSQQNGVAPVFAPDDGTTVQVVRRTVTRLGDITDGDLRFGSGYAVPVGGEFVQEYLASELSPGKEFSPDTVMTIYWIEYLSDEEPASD